MNSASTGQLINNHLEDRKVPSVRAILPIRAPLVTHRHDLRPVLVLVDRDVSV